MDRYEAALARLSKMADEAAFAADYFRRNGGRLNPAMLEWDAKAAALAQAFEAVNQLREEIR